MRREKVVVAVAIDNKLHRVNGTEELELVLGEAATAHQAFDLFHFLYAAFFHAAAIILVTGSREEKTGRETGWGCKSDVVSGACTSIYLRL